ncbi:MAG: hypothetical protein IPL50_05125 [Chitinophagaceae bacterium]|nr:hypothetical protein [Chitinophagaceae bacterium]
MAGNVFDDSCHSGITYMYKRLCLDVVWVIHFEYGGSMYGLSSLLPLSPTNQFSL